MKKLLPWNITLLNIEPRHLPALPPITAVEAVDRNFNLHPDGLFSTTIFGRVGDDRRLTSYARIDLKVKLIHPLIWHHLMAMRAFYLEVVSGRAYATFDTELGDFVKADILTGQTGYNFFFSNWTKLKLSKTKSITRNDAIDAMMKYRGAGDTADKIPVIPAGLRDIEINEDNTITKDELNDLYRKILAQSLSLSEIAVKTNPKAVDGTRYAMQLTWNAIFNYFVTNMGGKNHMIQGQYLARNLDDGTRNVITALSVKPTFYGDTGVPGFGNMTVGIYQAIRACQPNAIYAMKTSFIDRIFTGGSMPIPLINKSTKKTEFVHVDHNYQEKWRSMEGLVKIFMLYEREELRTMPVTIKDHYLCLTYRGWKDGKKVFKLVSNTQAIPDWAMMVGNDFTLTPTTMIELFYATTYHALMDSPAWSTRYPVADVGSTYPSKLFIRTTENEERRYPLDDNWEIDETKPMAPSFPSINTESSIINAASPHSSNLKQTNADFDGDKMAVNALQTPEARAAMTKLLDDEWEAYITSDGSLIASCETDTAKYVLFNMTATF